MMHKSFSRSLFASERTSIRFRGHIRHLCLLAVLFTLVACSRPQAGGTAVAEAVRPLGAAGQPASAFPAPSRPVADIITDTWSSEDTRDRAGEADTVMKLLDVRAGMHVADVGAGSGYYTVRLSPRVGAEGRVIAQDIMPEYLEKLRERVRAARLSNVTVALGEPHDPRLPAGSADLVMLVHMYHEVEQPYAFLHNLRPALRPGGRVAVVDLDRPTNRHGTPPALLRCELAAAGYRETGFRPLADGAYLAIFAAPAPEARPRPETVRPCRDDATAR